MRTEAESNEETRRTSRPVEQDQGETRRTIRTEAPPSEPAVAVATDAAPAKGVPTVKAARRRSSFGTAMRVVASLAIGCFVYGAYSAYGWMTLRGKGQILERQIKSEQLTDPNEIWTQWSNLSKNDPTSWALWGARSEVEHQFREAADAIIARFHNNTQVVSEKDWETAQTLLARVLTIDPDAETARGELRLCDGEIARINAFRPGRHDTALLNTAVEKFNEAARLLPKSPDPYLALASVYVYGLRDIDKADAALQEAQKRGYQLGNRERAELADGYSKRAERLFTDAVNVRGLPQEKDQVQHAADDYQRAIDLYQAILPYGNSAVQLVRLQHLLDIVNGRLHDLQVLRP
jgi:tetratricopeptide (TPR) repeat protein